MPRPSSLTRSAVEIKIAKHDWALGNYSALGDVWQRELETIVRRHVSLEAIVPGNDA
jgi:hypothetical protein